MNAPASFATWTETNPGHFGVRVSPTAAFHVSFEGARYYVVLPGYGIRRCWTRAEVERLCANFVEDMADEDRNEDDEDAQFASYRAARRAERAAAAGRL